MLTGSHVWLDIRRSGTCMVRYLYHGFHARLLSITGLPGAPASYSQVIS